jgi:hypothetical protein
MEPGESGRGRDQIAMNISIFGIDWANTDQVRVFQMLEAKQ